MASGTRSDAELAAAVLRRAGELRKEKGRRQNHFLAIAFTACFTLIGLFVVLGSKGINPATPSSAQASIVELMGGAAVGGYVLVGVITFALGVAVTLVCLRAKKREK